MLRLMWGMGFDASVNKRMVAAGDAPAVHLKVWPADDDSCRIQYRATIEAHSSQRTVRVDLMLAHDGCVSLRSPGMNAPWNPVAWRIGHDIDILAIAACLLDRASRATRSVPRAGTWETLLHTVRCSISAHRRTAITRCSGIATACSCHASRGAPRFAIPCEPSRKSSARTRLCMSPGTHGGCRFAGSMSTSRVPPAMPNACF